MIELDLRWAILLYICVVGGLFLGIWLYTELVVYRPQRLLGKQFLWQCTFCGYTYLDSRYDTISQCPRCLSYNTEEEKFALLGISSRSKSSSQDDKDIRSSESSLRKNPSLRKRPHQRHRGPRRRA